MPININGYNLSNVGSALSFGAGASNVNVYGVTNSALPSMLGSATAGGAYKGHPFTVNDVNLNIGACWSTSTYLFTCPVLGVYYTSYSGIVGDGTQTALGGYFALIRNGANHYFSYRDSNALWELMHIEVMIKCAAGDTLSWAMNASPGPDSGSVAGGYRSNHNTCTVWLVG